MPNTLVHLGVGRVASRTLFQNVDDKWIYIGCIIPDIPWIIQRLVTIVLPGIDLIELRLYAYIQASLFFCLILSTALSILARFGMRLWLLLGFNCLLHLLLDAAQIKWANGVHLFVPFSWRMINFGFFWPESLLAYGLTILGLVLILWNWPSTWHQRVHMISPAPFRWMVAAGILVLYLTLPLFLLQWPERADNQYSATLRAYSDRSGRVIAFDRCFYDSETRTIRIFSGESIPVSGIEWPRSAIISVKGQFVAADRIEVHTFHIHHQLRDPSSLLGLALVVILWFTAGWKNRKSKTHRLKE